MKNIVKNAQRTSTKLYFMASNILEAKHKGESSADKGLWIGIGVALLGIILFLARDMIIDVIGPELKKAITGFFNFK